MSAEPKCPFAGDARKHTVASAPSNADWWPNQLNLNILHQRSSRSDPMGETFDYAEGVQEPRPGRSEEGSSGADDGLAGLVAGGLRSLRPVVHSHGVAQRRHLPHGRRPRRRRQRQPALRAAQQLARQRQPRQGAPAALADQAEVRPQNLLGRPDDPHRQRCAGIDGIQDVRFRRRPRRHLGTGTGHLLGLRESLEGRRQALFRRARPGKSARCRADGSDLRQSGRARTATRIRLRRRETFARRLPAWR